MEMYCLACITEFMEATAKWKSEADRKSEASRKSEPQFYDMVKPAVTLAPVWQQNMIGPQLFVACVTVPSCLGHLAPREKSAAERALDSGLSLG